MVKQAINFHNNIYTRDRWFKDFTSSNVKPLPDLIKEGKDRKDDPFHWGSGPYAILLGATLSNNINIIGFDLYGSQGKVNNVYAGTDGYASPDKSAVDFSYWEYQIAKVFEWFPATRFTVYNTHDWLMPNRWKMANVSLDIIENL